MITTSADTRKGDAIRSRDPNSVKVGHTETVKKWMVDDTRAVEPTPGADCDASYLLKLSCGELRARSKVEFAAPSSVASNGWARDALAPFLGDDELPTRLIVSQDGSVRDASDAV